MEKSKPKFLLDSTDVKLHLNESIKTKHKFKKKNFRDFPGGPVVKNLPSNAGDVGLIPGQGTKIPRATGQLSLCATTIELMCLN